MPINIFQMTNYRRFLQEILDERKARNPNYSLRAFARDIQVSAARLCMLLQGKTGLSLGRARIVANRLPLTDYERDYFVALVALDRGASDEKLREIRQKHAFAELLGGEAMADDFDLLDFAEYLKISLLKHVTLEDAEKNFGVGPEALQSLCERLVSLGWVTGSVEEGWAALAGFVRAPEFDAAETRRIFHRKILELGQLRMVDTPVTERFFHSSVFSFRRHDYEELCCLIQDFVQSKNDAFQSRDRHDMIYALGVQLLPVAVLPRPPEVRDERKRPDRRVPRSRRACGLTAAPL